MNFDLSIVIHRPPADVFAFFRDKDKHQQKKGSPVLELVQTTPGPVGAGTRYREVVQMLPFFRGEIRSEVTCFEPSWRLDEDFAGPAMRDHLTYRFMPEDGGTRLIQQETVEMAGPARFFAPIVQRTLSRQLHNRLNGIKTLLESGYQWEERGANSSAPRA